MIMIYRTISIALLIAAALLLAGCPAPQEATKSEQPPPAPPASEKKPAGPDITLSIGSIDLSSVNRRVEQADIDDFCRTVLGEKLDILAVEGMTRYPAVATRVDIFTAIAQGTGMRSAFGETNTVSGRQGGNAIYSLYPINSHENAPYTGISSTNFESALLGLVDAGVREIAVVSTHMPEKMSEADQSACEGVLASLEQTHLHTPIIITGNMPGPGVAGAIIYKIEQAAGTPVHTWLTHDGLRSIRSTSVGSKFGPILVTQFGVYRPGRP